MAQELKHTLNLPQTSFPMRANLAQREPERIQKWEEADLYGKIQANRAAADRFVLHDGPPFTNGDLHMGHALNKTLKDIILRFKSMRGYATPYVPGWDCHGLPIEHKVSVDRRKKKKSMEPADVRKACAEFSQDFIDKQRSQFQRLGIMADWENEYETKKPSYEADILRTFASFVEKGLVYRSKKPVYWSIPCATALAEAEIEYKDHQSPSIWVAFPLSGEQAEKAGIKASSSSIVIWTTTPWTLPANMAVAVHPRLEYVEVTHEGRSYLVVSDLSESFIKDCKLEGAQTGDPIKGETLEGVIASHPFIERESPIVLADYVTTEQGTGCVHTAPGHGLEDYQTGLKYGLEIYCPLDDYGRYVDDGQMPADLVGVSVLEKGGKNAANDKVLELLKSKDALVNCVKYDHQYPHCWRSKTPVIFRAMDQWFVALDKDGMREKVLEQVGQVRWIPQWGEKRIRGAVESRPDWCISRQRAWGVPLPVFFDSDSGEPLLDAEVIRSLADKVAEGGTDLWYEKSAEELLEGISLPEGYSSSKLIKGADTLDVWIDSGCSHRAVLQRNDTLHWPADLYLEGSDQHRGWFQSSLWTAVVADGAAPYKNILTHGFIVDENKKKISKSDGKARTASDYIKQYGADVVRLWVASVDYRNDIPISDGILKQVVNAYRTVRNTLRFQIGNLHDFDFQKDAVDQADMTLVDKWALHKTAELIKSVTAAYEAYEFHRVYQLINNFCNEVLSATYHDILKDRLYTYAPHWVQRRSSQTVIHHVFESLIRLLAPVLTFTTDEAHSYATSDKDFTKNSVHCMDWPEVPVDWVDEKSAAEFERIQDFRGRVNEAIEGERQKKVIGQSLDAQVSVSGSDDDELFQLLKKHEQDLPEYFIVSQVKLVSGGGEASAEVAHAEGERCPRSWRWVPELVACEGYEEKVSPRCRDALEAQKTQTA